MNTLKFYDTANEFGFLSNFYKLKGGIVIDNEVFLNTESYFQAMKFRGEHSSNIDKEYSRIIAQADSPAKVKSLGTQQVHRFGAKWKINKKSDSRLLNDVIREYQGKVKLRDDWNHNNVKQKIMLTALLAKFTQHEELRKKFVSIPYDTMLIEHTYQDHVWGDGGDGSGKNYLGKLLTALHIHMKNNYSLDENTIFNTFLMNEVVI